MPSVRLRGLVIASILLAAYLATQPPILSWANRIEPAWLELPFLVWWLTGAYLVFCLTLVAWVWRKH